VRVTSELSWTDRIGSISTGRWISCQIAVFNGSRFRLLTVILSAGNVRCCRLIIPRQVSRTAQLELELGHTSRRIGLKRKDNNQHLQLVGQENTRRDERMNKAIRIALLFAAFILVSYAGLAMFKPKLIDVVSICIQSKKISHIEGNAFLFMFSPLQNILLDADSRSGVRSRLKMLEDHQPLSGLHAVHKMIIDSGNGKYSHWENESRKQGLIFSTSDNSDPRFNGRTYSARAPISLKCVGGVLIIILGILLYRERKLIFNIEFRSDRIKMTSAYSLVIIILLFLAVTRLGDWKVNLATHYADGDNIVSYTRYFDNPELYSKDPFAEYARQQMFGSAMNWIPALVSHYSGIKAETITYFIAIFQALAIGISMVLFARIVTGSVSAAMLSAMFLSLASVWNQNLAFYGIAQGIPYPGIFIIPFVLVTAGAAIQQHWKTVMVGLLGCALIHPSITIYMTLLLAIYIILTSPLPSSVFLKRLLCLIPAVLITVGLACILLGLSGDKVGADKFLNYANAHLLPYIDIKGLSDISMSYLGWLWLATLGIYSTRKTNVFTYRFMIATLYAVFILAVFAIFGIHYKILTVIQLIPLRSTMLIPILALPLICLCLLRFTASSFVVGLASLQLLQLHTLSNYGLFWGPLLAISIICFSKELKTSKLIPEIPAAIVYFAWNALMFTNQTANFSWLIPGFRPGPAWVPGQSFTSIFWYSLGMCAFLQILLHCVKQIRGAKPELLRELSKLTILLFFLCILTWSGVRNAREHEYATMSQESRDMAAAQEWAALKSPRDALFVVESIPFRTMSQRAVANMFPSFGFIYSRSLNAYNRDLRLLEFYNSYGDTLPESTESGLIQKLYEKIFSIDENNLRRLMQLLHGEYYVRKKNWSLPMLNRPTHLSLPIVYENDSYTIYRIEADSQ